VILKKCLLTEDNVGVMKSKPQTHKNISTLLGVNLTQSQKIRFGKSVFEPFVKNIITSVGGNVCDVHMIVMPNGKKKDVDLFFEYDGTFYYFEIKCNLNLDSEKSKVTDQKIIEITNKLSEKYDNIVSGCLTCWFDSENVVNKLKTKIYHMKDFFDIFNLDIEKDEYYDTFKEFGKLIKNETNY